MSKVARKEELCLGYVFHLDNFSKNKPMLLFLKSATCNRSEDSKKSIFS